MLSNKKIYFNNKLLAKFMSKQQVSVVTSLSNMEWRQVHITDTGVKYRNKKTIENIRLDL